MSIITSLTNSGCLGHLRSGSTQSAHLLPPVPSNTASPWKVRKSRIAVVEDCQGLGFWALGIIPHAWIRWHHQPQSHVNHEQRLADGLPLTPPSAPPSILHRKDTNQRYFIALSSVLLLLHLARSVPIEPHTISPTFPARWQHTIRRTTTFCRATSIERLLLRLPHGCSSC